MSCRVYSPCLLVAEFLGDDFAQVQSEAIRHSLGQVVVRAPAKKHDVGHIRDGGKIGLLWRRRREREGVGGIMEKEAGGDAKEKKGRRRRRRDRSPPAVWRKNGGEIWRASVAGRALHWCGGVDEPRGGEISCAPRLKGSGSLSLDAPCTRRRNSPELFELSTHGRIFIY